MKLRLIKLYLFFPRNMFRNTESFIKITKKRNVTLTLEIMYESGDVIYTYMNVA